MKSPLRNQHFVLDVTLDRPKTTGTRKKELKNFKNTVVLTKNITELFSVIYDFSFINGKIINFLKKNKKYHLIFILHVGIQTHCRQANEN